MCQPCTIGSQSRAASGKFKLTPTRLKVLEMLLEEHVAVGAYDLLDRLGTEGLGAHPPIIYRALEFWQGLGFVHKIECLSAYAACPHPDINHNPAFMICLHCRLVAEINPMISKQNATQHATWNINNNVRTAIEAVHSYQLPVMAPAFGQVDEIQLEATGTCLSCQSKLQQ